MIEDRVVCLGLLGGVGNCIKREKEAGGCVDDDAFLNLLEHDCTVHVLAGTLVYRQDCVDFLLSV